MAYPQVLVHVARTEGSVPREMGAFMRVDLHAVQGTVGGGHLEFQAIAQARAWLANGRHLAPRAADNPQRCALGPSLGQCCGGVVWLGYVWIDSESDWRPWAERLAPSRIPVAVFGGGHVGAALIRALLPLPFQVLWVDSREGFLSETSAALTAEALPGWVTREEIDPVEDAVAGLPDGARVLIMSFSHAEDLQVVRACLARNRTARGEGRTLPLPFIGLIGSKTKWARFRHRLLGYGCDEAALGQVTCPIGLPEIVGKEPEVIAASVVAQLLMRRAGPLV